MNDPMGHLDSEMMQDYLAGRLDSDVTARIEAHVVACESCANRVRTYRVVERALRQLPLEHTGRRFTDKVLEQAGLVTPKFYRLADTMAGVLAALFVGSVLLLVFTLTGVIPLTSSSETGSTITTAWNAVNTRMEDVLQAIPASLGLEQIKLSSVMIGALSVGVILILLGLDHLVGRWMARGNSARRSAILQR